MDPENTSRKPILFNNVGYKSLVTTKVIVTVNGNTKNVFVVILAALTALQDRSTLKAL